MNHRHRIHLFIAVALLMIFPLKVWSASQSAAKEEIQTVAVLPFEVHARDDARSLQQQIAAQLSIGLAESPYIRILPEDTVRGLIQGKPVDPRLALRIGQETGAAFVVTGSLTRLGDMLSADVGITDVTSKERSVIFAQGNELDPLIARLKNDILLKILTGQMIADVRLEGNKRIEDNVILNVLKSTKGKLFSKENLSADIKAIYALGYFKDIRARVADTPGGKILSFHLEERPLIISVAVEGTDDIDKEDIEGLLTVKSKQVLNMNTLQSDVENIKTYYKNEGFLNAEVGYRLEEQEKGVQVVLDIKENRELSIKEISFDGNRAYTDKELKEMMDTSERGMFHFISKSGRYNEQRLKQDIEKLTVFYLNNGYINASIGEPAITHDRKWIYVQIPVNEGKQFRIGDVKITGDPLEAPQTELMTRLHITRKDYFDREAIIKDIDILTEACKEEGYAYAAVSPRTVTREAEQKIDVTYAIEKGPLVYINRIFITGNTRTRDKVIRRELAVVEGDLYDGGKFKTSYMKLNRLRYFEEIDFQTGKGPEEGLMDIDIRVSEKPTGMVSVGAGYSARENVLFMAQVAQQNLFGRGQTLSLAAYMGSTTTNYELSFIEPWLFDIPLWSKFQLWDMERDYDSYDVDTQGFGTTLGYPLFEHVKGYVGYRLSTDTVKNIESNASSYIRKQEGTLTSSGVTLSLERDTTNDIMFPSEGSRNRASVEHTGTIFLGDASFTKYTASSGWYFPLPLDNVFGIRGRIGYIQPNEGKEIPVYERFYLGGINSVRGLRDVGPMDEAGDPMGGETMLSFNTEVIFPLIKDAGIKGVVFFDTGNAWNDGYHLGDMRKTAGTGVRWYSPIGPLRLEWGYVLDKKTGEASSRWEFTMGMFM